MTNDEIYIATLKEQINSGMYDHLFVSGYGEAKHDLVFLDIGANIGLVSIYAVPYCKRIVAVEPAPDTFLKLQENTRMYPMIECLDVALSPTYGKQEFFVNDLNFTASSTVNTYGTRTYVTGAPLIDILQLKQLDHVDVCKCDAEGAEGESLSYNQIFLTRNVIDVWFIETHNDPKTTWEHKLGTLVGNLARCGYTKQTIDGMAVTATKP